MKPALKLWIHDVVGFQHFFTFSFFTEEMVILAVQRDLQQLWSSKCVKVVELCEPGQEIYIFRISTPKIVQNLRVKCYIITRQNFDTL